MRVLALLLLSLGAPAWAQKEAFDFAALMKISRISDPQLSPDGLQVAFTVETIDLAANTRPRQIWVVPLSGATPPVQLTKEGTRNYRARWTPDSKQLVFQSARSGSNQIWVMNADGSDARQVTNLSTEADGVVVSPDGKLLVFTSEVYPECSDDACNKAKLDADNASKVKARTYTSLLYRHWNQWRGARRSHLFVVPLAGSGQPRDLTPGKLDVPTFSLGGPDDYAISPDSKEVAYVADINPNPALSTDTDIFTVSLESSSTEPRRLFFGGGGERSPAYSPSGKYLACRSQQRGGYESDRWRLAVMDRASYRISLVNEGQDRPVNSFTWAPDSSQIFFTIEDRGRSTVQRVAPLGGGARNVINGSSHFDDVQLAPDAKTMIYTEQSGSRPVEIFKVSSSGGSAVPLTKLNDSLLDRYQLTKLEDVYVDSTADKSRVHAFVVKPPSFDASKKYPVLFLIHGGPQGAWGESWTYRWNAQVFAGAGFVVVMPNPRGSTGYGQKFTDEINADWGGKVYQDIMAVVDHVAALPYADKDRMAAAGGSYGGYMVNWMLGHTDRFKAFVSHAGLFDLRSMAVETEEIWFPNWEFRGMPWDNAEVYTRWSPSEFVREFKTPTLVIHGELDFRVPYGQGLGLFTALQMRNIPSKLLLYPDEGHWIAKPQNSELWYRTFIDWVREWTAKKP